MNVRTTNILAGLGIALLTIQFLAAAAGKFTGAWDQKFGLWGYPTWGPFAVGLLEVVAVILLFFPYSRKTALLILMLVMVGAALTHLLNGEPWRIIHNLIIAGIVAGVFQQNRKAKGH